VPDPATPSHPPDTGLQIIAIIKMVKGVLLLGIALGVFRLLNQDVTEFVRKLAIHLRIDPENHVLQLLLEKLTNLPPRDLRRFGFISLFYSADLFAEGIGLWLNQAWAKYLLVVATGLFVPEEAYACTQHFTWERLALLLVNVAVLAYVAQFLWRKRSPPSTPPRPLEGGPA
jgi:uncharacterized membrane protein (DUF2068 family)